MIMVQFGIDNLSYYFFFIWDRGRGQIFINKVFVLIQFNDNIYRIIFFIYIVGFNNQLLENV